MPTTFHGQVWSVSEPANRVDAVIEVRGRRVVLLVGDSNVGDWNYTDISVRTEPDGYHIWAEGDEIVFHTASTGLVAALAGGGQEEGLSSRISDAAAETPTWTEPIDTPAGYPALRIIATLYGVLGYLTIGLGVMTFVLYLLDNDRFGANELGALPAIGVLVLMSLVGIGILAFADLLLIAVATERNTRRTYELIEELLAQSDD